MAEEEGLGNGECEWVVTNISNNALEVGEMETCWTGGAGVLGELLLLLRCPKGT